VKITALWQNFERRQEVQPTAPAPELQARLLGLEKEVATLKALLLSQDEELASRDSITSEERSINARLKREVLDSNERYNHSVMGLAKEFEQADQLESWLEAVQNECSEACKNAEKEKLKAEVERLEAEKSKAVKMHDKAESLLIRLRAKYAECKAITKRYLKELSYVPYL
jgi:uncharacterized small protein (DUF1192 family)